MKWEPEDLREAELMLDADAPNDEFVARFGRTRKACQSRVAHEQAARRRSVGDASSNRRVPIPSEDLIAEAVRRATTPRSLTAALMGDPPPGYSALERRA